MMNEEALLQLLPFSRATMYRMIKGKKFPGGTFISPHRRVWFEDEIVAWQNAVDERNPNRGRSSARRDV